MQAKSDIELLREYAETGVESAFTELVTRHANLVYSAAVRQTNSTDAAGDITQTVFISLARDARVLLSRMAPDASVAGWLFRCARNTALNHSRDEYRRYSRERQAMNDQDDASQPTIDWDQLKPVMDEAMSELPEPDFDALVLRFFKNQDLRAVGLAFGVTDDAAQKRVSRALERLRQILSRHGIEAGAAGLAVTLSANAVQAIPVGLTATIASAALTGAGSVASAAVAASTLTKVALMTTFQKTIVAIVLVAVGAVPALILQQQERARLRAENQSLRAQVDQLAHTVAPPPRVTTNAVVRSKNTEPSMELLRLRGEVGLLRQQNQGLARAVAERPLPGKAGEFVPSTAWENSGNASAVAAASTFAWAIKTGNTAALANVFVGLDETGADRTNALEQVSKGLQPLMAEIESSRLILIDDSVPDQITFWYQSKFKDGNTMVSPLTVLRDGNGWKVKVIIGGEKTGAVER